MNRKEVKEKRRIVRSFLCPECGGKMIAKGVVWRCEKCGFCEARHWKTDPEGRRNKDE
jgi:tRNA(Ile2) C34 agmatinyltransferase TiaS